MNAPHGPPKLHRDSYFDGFVHALLGIRPDEEDGMPVNERERIWTQGVEDGRLVLVRLVGETVGQAEAFLDARYSQPELQGLFGRTAPGLGPDLTKLYRDIAIVVMGGFAPEVEREARNRLEDQVRNSGVLPDRDDADAFREFYGLDDEPLPPRIG